jgi:hypothetical protein
MTIQIMPSKKISYQQRCCLCGFNANTNDYASTVFQLEAHLKEVHKVADIHIQTVKTNPNPER